MRTPASRLWLLSALVAGASGTGSLSFEADPFKGYTVSYDGENVTTTIIDVGYFMGETTSNFSWTNTTHINVWKVCLGNEETGQVIGESIPSGYDAGSSPRRIDTVPGDLGVRFQVSYTATGGIVTIDKDGLKTLGNNHRRIPLVFQVQWAEDVDDTTEEPVDEYSYSPVWGLADGAGEAQQMYGSHSFLSTGVPPIPQGTSAFLSAPTQTTTAGSTSTTATSVSLASTTSSSNASSSKSNTPKSFGPLSLGALIGIIIGGVAFIMLVLIIAIICIRRHRRGARKQVDHDRDAQDLMSDKEARAAGTAPDTPYSVESSQAVHRGRGLAGLNDNAMSMPKTFANQGSSSQRSSVVYSSLRNVTSVGTESGEGSGDGDGDSGMGDSPTVTHPSSSSISLHEPYGDLVQEQFNRTTAAASQHITAAEALSPSNNNEDDDVETEQSPLSPGGNDNNICEEPRPRASGSRTGTPQLGPTRLVRSDTPGGRSISDYLHEDGMTEDEIRRLEEEERALDEAIEQARTDSRAGRGR